MEIPNKKQRTVLFAEIKNTIHEIGGRSLADVKTEVRKALEEHLQGDDEEYNNLKQAFADDNKKQTLPATFTPDAGTALKPHELTDYVIALTSCVNLVKNKTCADLVRHVLSCSWLGRDEDFLKVFIQFLASLVSSQGSYLAPVLSMLVDKFHDSKPSSWAVLDFPDISRDTMRERLHTCLHYLLQMFPAAKAVLRNIVTNKLPYSNESKTAHIAFVDNLLRLKDYVPDMEEDVMDLIISHVVKIDVQMQIDLEDLDDEVTANVVYLLRNAAKKNSWEDDSDDESDAGSMDSDDEDLDPETERIKSVKSSVEKMDAILDTLFQLYSRHFSNPSSDDALKHYSILVREFTDIILPTYKSRHTQFLLFHFGQMSEQLIDAFCGTCISIAFQSNRPNLVRQAAAAYLASFVARGAHLPGQLVRSVFGVLLHHMDMIRENYESRCRGPDIKRYNTYYTLCQAVFYIYCFRWRDLVVSASEFVDRDDPVSYIGQDLVWLPNAKEVLSRNVYCKLNPLKVSEVFCAIRTAS